MSIAGVHLPKARTTDWITPKYIIDKLSPFDLDPCASVTQPWPTASTMWTVEDDGLSRKWFGHVWLNPPYGREAEKWLQFMSEHNDGICLIFARTETKMFFRYIWSVATALFFIESRLHFCRPNGERMKTNSGGPSVLVAYGEHAASKLKQCNLSGVYVPLDKSIIRHKTSFNFS